MWGWRKWRPRDGGTDLHHLSSEGLLSTESVELMETISEQRSMSWCESWTDVMWMESSPDHTWSDLIERQHWSSEELSTRGANKFTLQQKKSYLIQGFSPKPPFYCSPARCPQVSWVCSRDVKTWHGGRSAPGTLSPVQSSSVSMRQWWTTVWSWAWKLSTSGRSWKPPPANNEVSTSRGQSWCNRFQKSPSSIYRYCLINSIKYWVSKWSDSVHIQIFSPLWLPAHQKSSQPWGQDALDEPAL